MNKSLISSLLCIFVATTLSACTVKKNSNVKNSTVVSINQNENYEVIFDWSISQDRNNPKQIKKVLKLLCDIDFNKLDEMELSKGKEIQFYEPFYNYPEHTIETIENIIKIREISYTNNQWDRLIFDLYKKEKFKPIFEMVIESTPKYKSLLEHIIKTETNVYLVYNWGISENKNDPKQIEKVLKVIGTVEFNKLWEMEVEHNIQIDFYKPFYNYPNHNPETIKNIFDAKTDGTTSEDFSYLIFNLYKKENLKPIIEELTLSNPEYKEKLNSIIEFESQ